MLIGFYALFAITCLFAVGSNALRNRSVDIALYVIIGCAMILYCAFRPIGADQDSVGYYNYYHLDDYSLSLAAEPSFIILSNLTRRLSAFDGLTVLFFIYAVLGVTIKLYSFRLLTKLYWLCIIVYCSNYFLLHEFTQIRAGVASGLVLLSIRYIYERDILRFFSCIALASFFHYSALVVAPLYFMSNSKMSRIDLFLLYVAVPSGVIFNYLNLNLIYVIPIDLVQAKIDTYMQVESLRDIKLNPYNAVYLVKYIMLYVFIMARSRLSDISPYFPILIKFYAISLFSFLALSFNSAFAIRVSELFGIVEIILVPLLCFYYRNKSLAMAGVIIYSFASLAIALYETKLIVSLS